MIMPQVTDARSRPTLNSVLRRAHLSVALIAILLVGVPFIVAGLLMLRVDMTYNLELVARAASYTVEAAVVFDDQVAAEDSLALVVSRERVAQAKILGRATNRAQWVWPNGRLQSCCCRVRSRVRFCTTATPWPKSGCMVREAIC
jgi:hypothetical protein